MTQQLGDMWIAKLIDWSSWLTSIPVDPLQPVFCAMASSQILQVVDDGNSLRLGGTQEVVLDGIRVVSKGNLDRTLETMNLAVPVPC